MKGFDVLPESSERAFEALHVSSVPASLLKNQPHNLMKLVFKQSLVSGDLIDTKFYAYSSRKGSGAIHEPKAIFANSYILRVRAPQYFEPCECLPKVAQPVVR